MIFIYGCIVIPVINGTKRISTISIGAIAKPKYLYFDFASFSISGIESVNEQYTKI